MKTIFILIITFNFIYSIKRGNAGPIKFKESFTKGEKINIISGTVNSFKTQIPYDLYYLDICAPEDVILVQNNLGERLLSGKSYQTGYELSINENKKCKFLCKKRISKTAYKRINNLINKEYFINYFLDNLPVGLSHTYLNISTKIIKYNTGIPLGFIKDNQTYINNYYKINIQLNKINISIIPNKTYRDQDDDELEIKNITGYDIIGFDIEPFSINLSNITECIIDQLIKNNEYEYQELIIGEEIQFKYDTYFTFTDILYEERFDKYFYGDKFIHSYSVYISGIIIFVLIIILLYIYLRSIKSEIEIQNEKVISEEYINEYGWRNIAFDVFRRPYRGDILAAFFGTGMQLLIMVLYSLLFVALGIIRPKSGGSYFTLLVMVYIFLSLLSGYFSAKFYKMVHGLNWLKVCVITCLLFPSIFLILITSINFLYWFEGSTTYIEFKNFFSLISLWIVGTVPLIFIGTMIGLTQKRVQFPCEVNPVPGIISRNDYPWYLRIRYGWFLTGFPPFFAIFVELFYIMDSLWKQDFYALSKYLLISILILIIISSLTGILFTYLNLCKGDYRWWWKSFLVSASPGIYIIIFSFFYLFKMKFKKFTSILIYLNFMTLFSIIISLICGSTGFYMTFLFIYNIYSKLKIN